MKKNTKKTAGLELTFLVKQVGEEWNALCLELDIASCGASQEEVIESLKGLIELYVADCLEDGAVPIPLRRVPPDALRKFLSPAGHDTNLPLTSHREYVPVHAVSY
jgi:predicted RNase H-like HicB family nuclease